MIHDLKTWSADFKAINEGIKTHEARRNDRDFAVGDTLRLREWTPDAPADYGYAAVGLTGTYSGYQVDVEVTYLTGGGQYGLPSDLCVMSIRRLPLVLQPLPVL
jgi:hypothetical protein